MQTSECYPELTAIGICASRPQQRAQKDHRHSLAQLHNKRFPIGSGTRAQRHMLLMTFYGASILSVYRCGRATYSLRLTLLRSLLVMSSKYVSLGLEVRGSAEKHWAYLMYTRANHM